VLACKALSTVIWAGRASEVSLVVWDHKRSAEGPCNWSLCRYMLLPTAKLW